MAESKYNEESIVHDFMNCKDIAGCNSCNAGQYLSGFNNTKIRPCDILNYYSAQVQNKLVYVLENEL